MRFLSKFFFTYLVLTLAYNYYLVQYDEANFETDSFTKLVSNQVVDALSLFDVSAISIPHESQSSYKLIYNGKFVARIIEGCNAISVMILFTAFVVAFTGNWKPTLLFILLGLILIHILNVTRIALLSAALFYYPEYEHLLHGVIFPLFIYGVVFGLWVIWVNKFSLYAKKNLAA